MAALVGCIQAVLPTSACVCGGLVAVSLAGFESHRDSFNGADGGNGKPELKSKKKNEGNQSK